MQRVLIYICILTLAVGCKSNKKKQLEKAAMEVMEVHDRTMKDHGELFKLKKKLLAIDLTQLDSIEAGEVSKTIVNLEKADEDMMDWMHNYKSPEEIMPFEEQLAYYREEKKKIEDIELFSNKTKEKAKALISFYPPPSK
jgi:hypothetical protein